MIYIVQQCTKSTYCMRLLARGITPYPLPVISDRLTVLGLSFEFSWFQTFKGFVSVSYSDTVFNRLISPSLSFTSTYSVLCMQIKLTPYIKSTDIISALKTDAGQCLGMDQ